MEPKATKITDKDLENTKSYMAFSLPYNCRFIVPYADGVKFIGLLEHAEMMDTEVYDLRNSDKLIFRSSQSLSPEFCRVTNKIYREAKMNLLLGIPNEE